MAFSEGDKLSMGVKAWVYADMTDDSGSNATRVGFVSQWSIRKSIQTTEARCVGVVIPVSIDVMGISVEVSLSGFVPTVDTQKEGTKAIGGGAFSLKYFNPATGNVLDSTNSQKIPYLAIVDETHDKTILSYAKWLTPTAYNESGSAQDYIKCDVTLKGIQTDNGSSYTDFTSTTNSES